ncbi:hypothetical protein [Variovorax boronicumulans]|uniref:hypothetical protein n=1 Tax=Variovorax boronicumulans TaxID=436515 RepID=UPI0012FD05FD|nr:hypothetical protein [Variovorax boronicumulans]
MATPPARIELADTYPNPSNAVFRTGIGKLWDTLFSAGGLLGATGNPVDARAALGVGPLGQCQLTKSGANILLSRFNGRYLTINNEACVIPAAGVTLAPTGLVASTRYYIYAYMVGTVMTLEAVTTAPVLDATTGVKIKTGAATRTLVGMVFPGAGPAFIDAPSQRFVISWFNQRSRSMSNAVVAPTNKTNTVFAEVDATKRIEFLTWGDSVDCKAVFTLLNTGANNCAAAIGFDGVAAEDGGGFADGGSNVSYTTITASAAKELTEGYHYATMLQRQLAGTTTWHGGAVVGERCAITGSVMG